MAKYDVTYTCGHKGEITLFGNHRDREWRRGQEEAKLCPECYKLERERQNAKAAEENVASGLPAMVGTLNQVAWAERIRRDALIKMESMYNELNDDAKGAVNAVMGIESASWWIDTRLEFAHPVYPHALGKFLISQLKVISSKPLVNDVLPEAQAAKFEATVRPGAPKTETVAEVLPTAGKVTIVFPERRDDFRTLVKSLGYRWDDTAWVRTLSIQNGTPSNRAAEAGHRLLAAGFIVCIYDQSVRDMAIKGTYEREQSRWIYRRNDGKYEGWFAINWGSGDDYYDVARRLPGSRWSKPSVVVPAEQFEEVLDFAQMYGFALMENAEALVEAVRAAKQAMLVAAVPAPKRKKSAASTLIPELEAPKEVSVNAELRDKD